MKSLLFGASLLLVVALAQATAPIPDGYERLNADGTDAAKTLDAVRGQLNFGDDVEVKLNYVADAGIKRGKGFEGQVFLNFRAHQPGSEINYCSVLVDRSKLVKYTVVEGSENCYEHYVD